MVQPLGHRCYAPRSSSNLLKVIVEAHLDELRQVYDERFRDDYGPLHPRVLDLFERFTACGDAHFGFLRFRCPHCKEERLVAYSCKARGLCPSCGKKRALLWAEHMVKQVLPEGPYAPLVFTIPKMLRPFFKWDHGLYGDLCRAAYRAVREFLEERFSHLENPTPAFVACPQSFGSLLNFHPHGHGLVSMGVFDASGNFHQDLDIDFSEVELRFREAIFDIFKKRGKLDDDRIRTLRSWPHSGFRVYVERMIAPGNTRALENILEYMERPPVSLKRLRYFDTGMVVYQGNYHPQLRRSHQVVTGVEFLAMLVPHIQLRYEYKARCYGAISTTLRRRFGWIQEDDDPGDRRDPSSSDPDGVDDVTPPRVRARTGNWARLIRKVWLEDPERCPKCGTKLELLSAISSPGQDDIIRKILQARGEWDPPWESRAPPEKNASDPGEPERVIEYELDPEKIWPDE